MAFVRCLLWGRPTAGGREVQSQTRLILQRQANDLNSMLTSIRGYYSSNVVARVLDHGGANIKVIHNYEVTPGAIPIPATLSLELGGIIADKQSAVAYRFVSDYPFSTRAPHVLDEFERSSLASLRMAPDTFPLVESTSAGLHSQVRMITPVIMGAACANCHNSHPESTKRDWKVGDVRGIQEVIVNQPIAFSLGSFKFSMLYFL